MDTKKKIVILFFVLFGQLSVAQKAFYIRPALGLHTPFAKKELNGYKPFVTLVNNSIWLTLKYEIAIEYDFKPQWAILTSYGNGHSGFSMGVLHTRPCMSGGPPPDPRGSDLYKARAYNDKRLLFQLRHYLKPEKKDDHFHTSIEAGIGLDFKSNENDSGRIFLAGVNQCGEDFYLDAVSPQRKKVGWILPLQINFEWQKFMLSFFYHKGLTEHFLQEIDYVTNNYTDKAFFKVRGTTLGFKLSYPIKIWKQKEK